MSRGGCAKGCDLPCLAFIFRHFLGPDLPYKFYLEKGVWLTSNTEYRYSTQTNARSLENALRQE